MSVFWAKRYQEVRRLPSQVSIFLNELTITAIMLTNTTKTSTMIKFFLFFSTAILN